MARTGLILYHAWSSSASRKVRLCLAEKGLDYESRVMDLLRFQHHSDWYKALNPGGIAGETRIEDSGPKFQVPSSKLGQVIGCSSPYNE